MRTKQLSLLPKEFMLKDTSFGGDLLVGKRKAARPITAKNPIHMVLKSTKAKGNLSFMNHRKKLDEVLRRVSNKWGITLMKHEWNWDHLHSIIRVPNRTIYNNWMRELTAALVHALSIKTGTKLSSFFDHRPFTRIIQWGKDLKNALDYLELNQMEIFGCRPFKKKGKPNSTRKKSAKRSSV
jgi:REP element-mobilizing transposase RayT